MYLIKSSTAILGALLLNSCTSNEIGNSRDVAPDAVYQQYYISYKEGEEKVQLNAQFRFGGANGTTLVLNKPSSVQLDGRPVAVDSNGLSGAFYQSAAAVTGFEGKHQYIFTDINGKKYENGFEYQPFKLAQVPGSTSKKEPLSIVFDGSTLRDGDEITIGCGGDSSFSVTYTISGNNYTAHIPVAELARQRKSKLALEISLRRSIALQQQTTEGGKMELSIDLKPVAITLKQ